MVSDTFLPVNEAAQFAAPALLQKSHKSFHCPTTCQKFDRTRNWSCTLAERLLSQEIFIRPEGGFFSLTLKVDQDEEELALRLRLLKEQHVLVHPGYFYDMDGQ